MSNSNTSLPTVLAYITPANAERWREGTTVSQSARARLHVNPLRDGERLTIVDLRNAFLSGERCPRYILRRASVAPGHDPVPVQRLVLALRSLRCARGYLESMDWGEARDLGGDDLMYEEKRFDLDGTTFEMYRRDKKAIRCFSQLELSRVKKLNGPPKRWTVRMAARAIVNEQFSDLECKGQYSDDYYRDAQRNYGKGAITQHLPWIKKIIEDPSGWKVRHDPERGGPHGLVSLDCHLFDCNQFVPSFS